MNNIEYFICNYADYAATLPTQFSCCHTSGHERKSLDGTKFISWCGMKCGISMACCAWRDKAETSHTHAEILEELKKPEWFDPEAILLPGSATSSSGPV